MPHTLPSMLDALTTEPGRPRLTWYGDGGERIELSGAVLVNWVSKTTNLLVEELDAEPGTVVATDLPPHWRTLVWALATWRAGAALRLVPALSDHATTTPGDDQAEIVVTDTPERWAPAGARRPRGELVVVTLAALARSYGGDLPRGAVDAAAAVMTYGDQLGYVVPSDGAEPALETSDGTVLHSDLLAWAQDRAALTETVSSTGTTGAPAPRTLVTTPPSGAGPDDAVPSLLATALTVWATGGSVVLLDAVTTREVAADEARLERLVSTERITHRA